MVWPRQSLVRLRLVPLPTGRVYGAVNFSVPHADVSDEVMEDPDTHLPSGVAGQFNANSIYTNVVGAFAAEKQ